VIVGFRHEGLEAFYQTGSLRGIQPTHARKPGMILAMLDVASAPQDLNLPALRLHALKGDLKGHGSIWVNGNWRITFRFADADVELVGYQDYH
jgi:proteic killer suppression protein